MILASIVLHVSISTVLSNLGSNLGSNLANHDLADRQVRQAAKLEDRPFPDVTFPEGQPVIIDFKKSGIFWGIYTNRCAFVRFAVFNPPCSLRLKTFICADVKINIAACVVPHFFKVCLYGIDPELRDFTSLEFHADRELSPPEIFSAWVWISPVKRYNDAVLDFN
jgi:hypothetical protein